MKRSERKREKERRGQARSTERSKEERGDAWRDEQTRRALERERKTERERVGREGIRSGGRLGWCVSQARDTRENGAVVASLIRYVRSMRPLHHPLPT